MTQTRGPGIGPLIQLNAKSLLDDDIYTIGLSEESIFKSCYLQYNPFSIHHEKSNILTRNFGKNIIYDIPKKSHVIKDVYLVLYIHELVEDVFWTNAMAFHMIKNLKLRCGNFEFIDIPGEYLYLNNYLSVNSSKRCYESNAWMFNTIQSLKEYSRKPNQVIIKIPIMDYFPLIAIKENDLRITLEMNELTKLICANNESKHIYLNLSLFESNIKVFKFRKRQESAFTKQYYHYQFWIDYIELSFAEQSLYLHNKLTYLITQINQLSYQTTYSKSMKIDLDNFENPTTQLIITVERVDNVKNNYKFIYLPIKHLSLTLNNIKRKSKFEGRYFRNKTNYISSGKNIHCIPFSIIGDTKQPSGTYNFSQTKNNFIEITLDPVYESIPILINIYGPSYNQITIGDGELELLFS